MSEHRHHHHHHRRDEDQYGGGYPDGNSGYGYNQAPYAPPQPAYGYGAEYPQPGYGGYPPQQPGYGGYEAPPQPGYGGYPPPQPGYGGYQAPPQPYGYAQSSYSSQTYVQDGRMEAANQAYEDERRHKKNEHRAELGALAAGAFALTSKRIIDAFAAKSKEVFDEYEEHEVKVDPEHAGRHRIEESIAGATALGAGGYAVYEHQQIRNDQRIEQSAYPQEHHKKHHFF